MPRPYRLGRRAAPKAEMRDRIIAAALAIYRERGLAGASNLASPRRPMSRRPPSATISRSRAISPRAVFADMLVELRIPTPAIFDGLSTPRRTRVERLAGELAAFYERSEPWWRAYEREPELISAWSGGVDQYYADIERLMRAALGDLSTMTGRWPSLPRSSGRRRSSLCGRAASPPTKRSA